MARPTGRDLREETIAVATRLVQERGVNGFSYGDLAQELGVKAPSIHHHFRTKQDLLAEVARRYRAAFAEQRDALPGRRASDRITGYSALFAGRSAENQLCLCGAVAADWYAVGELPRAEVEEFFADQVAWLRQQIRMGIDAGEFTAGLDIDTSARSMLAALEGSLLMSRVGGARALPTVVAVQLLEWMTD